MSGIVQLEEEKTAIYNATFSSDGELYLGTVDDSIHSKYLLN